MHKDQKAYFKNFEIHSGVYTDDSRIVKQWNHNQGA